MRNFFAALSFVCFTLSLVAVAKPPEPLILTQLSDCMLLQYKAPSLSPEARAKVELECKPCFSSQGKPGQKPLFELTVKDANTAQGKCTMKAVAVLPQNVQMPGNDAAFRCAGLFAANSSDCQKCVNGGGAFLEWPEGKVECATKPKGPAISKPAECVFAGKAGKDCIQCLFEKKQWKVDAKRCE